MNGGDGSIFSPMKLTRQKIEIFGCGDGCEKIVKGVSLMIVIFECSRDIFRGINGISRV